MLHVIDAALDHFHVARADGLAVLGQACLLSHILIFEEYHCVAGLLSILLFDDYITLGLKRVFTTKLEFTTPKPEKKSTI